MRASFDKAEALRVRKCWAPGMERFVTQTGDRSGMFIFAHKEVNIRMFVDDGKETGWEHVSVSGKIKDDSGQVVDFTPSWDLMAKAKELFWEDEECVVQFHPPKSVYVNRSGNVLHLWRKVGVDIETPPMDLV